MERALEFIERRGPDGSGFYQDSRLPFFMAHTRLAIVDKTLGGHQPMASKSGDWVMAFNGEIYNHKQLLRSLSDLQRSALRGHSDTEVLLELISEQGLRDTLERVEGMFAIALWHIKYKVLYLVRDRMGQKPLYYGQAAPGRISFGSTLDSVRALSNCPLGLSDEAICLYLQTRRVGGARTMFKEVLKVLPGEVIKLELEQDEDKIRIDRKAFWSVGQAIRGESNTITASYDRYDNDVTTQELLKQLRKVISLQVSCDVEVGAFLSGGTDSSLVTALLQHQSPKKIQTFTLGFQEIDFDERSRAKKISSVIGTTHKDSIVTDSDILCAALAISKAYDEPLADVSAIPTWLVSRLAKDHVGVVLTGDGADELFGGYDHYAEIDKNFNNHSLRVFLYKVFSKAGGQTYKKLQSLFFRSGLISGTGVEAALLYGIQRYLERGMSFDALAEYYVNYSEVWWPSYVCTDSFVKTRLYDDIELANSRYEDFKDLTEVQQAMLLDQICYLPDDILMKTDRASMYFGLELRAPFLDRGVVEFAWQHSKSGNGRFDGKRILAQALSHFIPKSLVWSRKRGFGVPIGSWLRGPLRDWAYQTVQASNGLATSSRSFIDLERILVEHMKGRAEWGQQLWSCLVLDQWLLDRN